MTRLMDVLKVRMPMQPLMCWRRQAITFIALSLSMAVERSVAAGLFLVTVW